MDNSRIRMRKIQFLYKSILNNIKFKIESFSFSKIIILVWTIIWFISMFMKWIVSENKNFESNIFNSVTNSTSIILIILFLIILFLLFSISKKEKIKKSANIIFRDYIIIIIISIITFILAINSLWIIIWLRTFSSEVFYWPWIIILMISSIFIFIGAMLLKNEYYSLNNIYLNDSKDNRVETVEKNNTKLPF